MNQTKFSPAWLLMPIGGLVAAGSLLLFGSLSSAQVPTPDTTTTPGTTTTPTTGSTQSSSAQSYDEILADELGIDVDELREAQSNARDRYFDVLAQSGRLTQQQAADLKASSPGELMGGVLGTEFDLMRHVLMARSAQLMNTDRQSLERDLSEGKTLEQIAEENNVSVQEIRSEIEAAADQLIDMAQQGGLLTSEEASDLRDAIDRMIERVLDDGASSSPMSETPTPVTTP